MMIIKQSKNGKFPLILLHGWGLNSAVWQPVFAALSEDFDVHCIDLPGFGQNQRQRLAHYDLSSMAEAIQGLIPVGSIVLGWSLGGLVAIELAVNYPDKVAALYLLASTPCFAQRPGWPGIKPQVLDDFSQSLLTDRDKTIARFLAIQTQGCASARQDIRVLKQAVQQQPKADTRALADGLAILKNTDLRLQLQSLKLPVRGLYGRLDTLVAASAIIDLAADLHDFQYLLLEQAAHVPFISHQQSFIDDLAKWHQFLG